MRCPVRPRLVVQWLRFRSGFSSAGRAGRDLLRGGIVPARALALGGVMAFLVGLVLFIGLCGYLDSRLPWPSLRRRQR